MAKQEDDDPPLQFSSPPCFMHELTPGYDGNEANSDPVTWADVTRWRKAERERLIALRLEIAAEQRLAMAERIAHRLDALIGDVGGGTVSIYWPFRGELDFRPWAADVSRRGGIIALPVVVEKKCPMLFRAWRQGDPMQRGIWNIPVPAAGAVVTPDIVLAPLVGFDGAKFRLGYGGGYFDRTLAALPVKPLAIRVGFAQSALATIYPQAHDIPMDHLLVE